MDKEIIFTIVFLVFVVFVLLIDLVLVGRKAHVISTKEALIWSAIWIFLGVSFYFFLNNFGHLLHGIDSVDRLKEIVAEFNPYIELDFSKPFDILIAEYRKSQSINYLSGYFIEKTLSIDNIFVMLVILKGFSVPEKDYKKILFWGILGAIVLRFIFIFAGVAIIRQFEWILIVFGLFLLYQGGKIMFEKEKEAKDPKESKLIRFLNRHINIHPEYDTDRFWLRREGKLFFTPLLLVLIMVELSDLVFAFDSIPAIFAVSRDPFIVFFSNIFAILGLRSLFFLLANLVNRFRFLKYGISLLLIFVGLKLTAHNYLKEWGFKPEYSLYIIAVILIGSVLISLLIPSQKKDETTS
ncbi:MAG: TerC/Alx family metal homeostasis membrane protein [Draconibacterium sp.]